MPVTSSDPDLMIPVYVTRKTAGGVIGTWSIDVNSGLRLLLLARFLAFFGMSVAVLWLCIAVVLAVKLIVGWF